jgi:hypothetical protein
MSSLLLGLAVTVAVALAQLPAAPPAAVEPSVPVPAVPAVSGSTEPPQPSGPFQKLFSAPANDARTQARLRAALEQLRAALEQRRQETERSASKIVCGMVVLHADPAVDPKMIVRPQASATTMHIRKIPPSACAG